MTTGLVPPIQPALDLDVMLTADNLLALADELCAGCFSLSDGVVVFTARQGADVQRWQGALGARGLVRLPDAGTP